MDREDRRRYFIVGSVILEVVTPVFQQRLESHYQSKGLGSLKDFINSQPVLHVLFHLRHRNVWCCRDVPNCRNNLALPLTHRQWDMLYTENPGPRSHHCHCKYMGKSIQLTDLDITLAGLILLNCCNLGSMEEMAVRTLRQFKNDYLSHNTKGQITEAEFNTLWNDIETNILRLDPTREDDILRIVNRPLDDQLCNKYYTCLLDIHQKLHEMDTSIKGVDTAVQQMAQSVQGAVGGVHMVESTLHDMNGTLQELLFYARRGFNCQCYEKYTSSQVNGKKPYKIGQQIFNFHHQSDLNISCISDTLGLVMMGDGRLAISLFRPCQILTCNTDGSEVDSIQLQSPAWDVTVVNNSTVAVTLPLSKCIEMYDINNKHKLKSIPVPGVCMGITTINNMLVVGCTDRRLLMIDDQTGEVVQTIHTDCKPRRLQTSGDRIFYCDSSNYSSNHILYCYNYTDDKVTTLTLPSTPYSITSLQDGSLYVVCMDRSVQHVSSDLQQHKPVYIKGLNSNNLLMISYNSHQRKLVSHTHGSSVFEVFYTK